MLYQLLQIHENVHTRSNRENVHTHNITMRMYAHKVTVFHDWQPLQRTLERRLKILNKRDHQRRIGKNKQAKKIKKINSLPVLPENAQIILHLSAMLFSCLPTLAQCWSVAYHISNRFIAQRQACKGVRGLHFILLPWFQYKSQRKYIQRVIWKQTNKLAKVVNLTTTMIR